MLTDVEVEVNPDQEHLVDPSEDPLVDHHEDLHVDQLEDPHADHLVGLLVDLQEGQESLDVIEDQDVNTNVEDPHGLFLS